MDFRVPCECGQDVVVSERSAGARVECACGREVRVPALHELRVSAGLPPYPLSPEMEIEYLLGTDTFPRRGECARCGADTDSTVPVLVQIGEEWTESTSVMDRLAFVLLFGWVGLLFARRQRTGFQKVYRLPLHVCPACRPRVRRASRLRECLRTVEVYDRLLEKHPYAVVKRG
jgi:hypothetical protein